ncbi:progranulin-like, partial [Saccoglossus kowalevskii]
SLSTQSIVCPDQSICMDGCTCCPVSTGGFGGCPLAKAVCCADEQHCCPNGYKCSLSDGSCYLANIILPWVEHAPAVPIDKNVEVVVCPGGKQECPSQMTCCSVHRDLYGCCPVPDAVCCDDKIHCCPKDYTCKDSRCLNGDINLPMLERVSAKYTHKVESVMCPDGQSECPDGSTCCILASGQYGCCPLPKAVCCDDHQHCCPNGYKCDTAGGSCQKGDDAIPWLKKHNSIPMSGNVKCQDGSECPSGSTCCKLPTGDYGCCPYLDAVCCNDGLHCCPKGYTCNTKEGTCQKASINMLPWVKSSEGLVDLVTCPDKAKCPDKTTCCQLPSDKYACCPLEHAICCEDKIHCCPDYLTCDMPSGKCVRKSIISIPWMEKIPTLID